MVEFAAWQIGLWREVERYWGDRPDRPPFWELFGVPASISIPILLIVACSAWWAIRKLNPGPGITDPALTWLVLMLWWGVTLLLLPVPGWLLIMAADSAGTRLLLATYGIPLATGAALWNAIYVWLAREKPTRAEQTP